MTDQELQQKINDINGDSTASPEEKTRRINLVKQIHTNIQNNNVQDAKRKQELADADLKSRLKSLYMANPAATAEDFERDYPQLKTQFLTNEVMTKDAATRAQASEAIRSSF